MVRRLIVDGYNVIRLTPPYRDLADHDLDAARTALISDVGAYATAGYRATVVFDGGANPLSTGESEQIAGVEVIFSRHGVEADAVVEQLARTARERGEEVEVVTSDAQTQWAVMGGTTVRRSAGEFAGELRDSRAEWAECTPTGSPCVRLEDRIDPEIRRQLDRMIRRGE